MNALQRDERARDVGLLFLRVSGGLFLLWVHGLPKLLDFTAQLQLIEDPFHLGATLTLSHGDLRRSPLSAADLAGVLARLACLPILIFCLSRCWWCTAMEHGTRASSAGYC